MASLNFFKTPKHQRYNYIPRYWNPEKEDREARLQKYKGEKGNNDVEAVKARLSRGFKRGSGGADFRVTAEMRARENKRSNKMLLIIIASLCFISYLLLSMNLEELLKLLG